jgi:hypothetical protein
LEPQEEEEEAWDADPEKNSTLVVLCPVDDQAK